MVPSLGIGNCNQPAKLGKNLSVEDRARIVDPGQRWEYEERERAENRQKSENKKRDRHEEEGQRRSNSDSNNSNKKRKVVKRSTKNKKCSGRNQPVITSFLRKREREECETDDRADPEHTEPINATGQGGMSGEPPDELTACATQQQTPRLISTDKPKHMQKPLDMKSKTSQRSTCSTLAQRERPC